MIKKKDAAIRMVQHKQQQQKLHQMQQVQQGQPVVEQHSGQSSASNSQTDLQPSVPLQSSQQQQQPNNIYQFNPQHAPAQAPYIQQNHSFVPPGVNLPVAAQLQQQHQGGYMGPAHPHQQPGVFSTYNNSIPQNSNMGGFTSQLGSGQLLTPINTVNVNLTDLSSGGGGGGTNMPAGYPGNSLGNLNPSSGPHPPQLGNGNNGMGGFNGMNMQANMAANMANNRPSNTMIFNSSSNPSGLANNNMNMSTNNISSNMNNSASAAANNAAKKPAAAKRTADKAGLENPGEKKAAKKRNPPAAKPTGMGTGGMVPGMLGAPGSSIGSLGQGQQGQGPQQAQVQGQVAMIGSLSNLNRPLNVPGGQSNMFAGLAGLSGAGIGGVGGASGGGHAQPPTVAQEIESMTERLNSVQEGIEPVGDNAAAAPLITPDFVRQEAELSRGNLRMSLPGQGLSASQQQQHGVGLDGQPRNPLSAAASSAAVELAQAWQFSNIADRGMLGRAAVQVLEGTDIKIGVSSLSALSNGIQQHLKNVLESAYKVSKSRANKTAINSYEGIYRMIVDHGKGNALPENTQNIAIRWGEDVRTILHAEEHAARKALKQYDSALEEDLNAKMRAFDEERARSGNKRKAGAEADVAWWTKEV